MQTLELDPVIIAVIAGVWNAGHTLQQRYGITRIYFRKPLGRAVRSRPGPLELMVMYTVGVAALIWAIRSFGSYDVYGFTFLRLGALYLFYDGLIWKLRRPEAARGFQIPAEPWRRSE
jgi:hypothetical protein